ncbi:hypothetical protein XI09_17165 [Bradyrhizobium sp. CCBAU 11386]|nr:hypothetical protein [Bradyrhizobium sp. CCBAU 11386]
MLEKEEKPYDTVRLAIRRKLAVRICLGAMSHDDRIGPPTAFGRLALLGWEAMRLTHADHCFSVGGMLAGGEGAGCEVSAAGSAGSP